MSAALINRSLTTIRTELEFLKDSDVITDDLYEKLLGSIPNKYQKDMQPWGSDKIGGSISTGVRGNESTNVQPSVAQITNNLSKTSISGPAAPPSAPPRLEPTPVGYCKAIYDYQSQEQDDLPLLKDDKIAVVEHLSEDWWKGYRQQDGPDRQGVFPSNYVNVISQQEFEASDGKARAPPPLSEKASYSPPPPQYNNAYVPPSQPQPPLLQQPSYGGYAQYPPPSANYYPPAAVPQPAIVEQQGKPHDHSHLRKFGGKLGNAAIFGAGATIGSDIVNSIF